VSEAAPGLPDPPDFATPERARLAEAVRQLIDAVMTNEGDDPQLLLDIAAEAEDLAQRLGAGRDDGPGYEPRSHSDYLPRSPVVGDASPLSPRLDWEVVDDRVHAHGRFGAAYEGPPGYVHGGVVALAFDEVLGIANIVNGSPGMTATLTVRYRRPMPLLADVRFVAWVERVDGRRIVSHAEAWNGETRCAEAEGLFVQPRPEIAAQYFGPRPGS
jgi:acyl-coenzyme A thioesterase PaaI-like protein